jgi:hypothetical protein
MNRVRGCRAEVENWGQYDLGIRPIGNSMGVADCTIAAHQVHNIQFLSMKHLLMHGLLGLLGLLSWLLVICLFNNDGPHFNNGSWNLN